MISLESAKKDVGDALGCGLIAVADGGLVVTCPAEPTQRDVASVRSLAHALLALAEALEGEPIPCSERLPGDGDADSKNNVMWLRSGVWMLGRYAPGQPVDATHWRRILS